MKAVVEEVLNGKKTTSLQKSEISSLQPPSTKFTDHDALQQLIRPNYQKKNIEKRMNILNHLPKQEQRNERTTPSRTSEIRKQSKSSFEDSISQLKKVSLTNEKSEHVAARTLSQPGENARLIGSTKDGSSIWFFPSVHPNLSQMFHRATSGCSVAIINSKACYPSQLLILNEWLNKYPDLKYHLLWNKANNHSFTLELYHSNTDRLEIVAKDIYQHISKRSLASVETYHLISPSAWISKQLGITRSVESVGIVEGLSYYNNLLILDHFYKNEPNPHASVQLEQHYLLTTGKVEAIKETLSTLKKLADRV